MTVRAILHQSSQIVSVLTTVVLVTATRVCVTAGFRLRRF